MQTVTLHIVSFTDAITTVVCIMHLYILLVSSCMVSIASCTQDHFNLASRFNNMDNYFIAIYSVVSTPNVADLTISYVHYVHILLSIYVGYAV